MEIQEFQTFIEKAYKEKDARRGIAWTYAWFVEEVGELGAALRTGDPATQIEEFADVFAWLCGLANLAGVRLEDAIASKYGGGCPVCSKAPCECREDVIDS